MVVLARICFDERRGQHGEGLERRGARGGEIADIGE